MKSTSLTIVLIAWTLAQCFGQMTPTEITSDHIRITHRGPIDKPIFPLIITTTKLQLANYEIEVLVDSDLFLLVRDFLKTNNLIEEKKELNEFGVFEVINQEGGRSQSSYFPSRLKSISILTSLKDKISGRSTSEKLMSELDKILKRIDF
jgi:hypothetical protein